MINWNQLAALENAIVYILSMRSDIISSTINRRYGSLGRCGRVYSNQFNQLEFIGR